MRNDNFVKDVLERCEALKTARLWAAEPKIRPRAWLHNFDEADRWVAAELLSRFTFYNQTLTELLFLAAYRSLFDGLPKGPNAPARDHLIAAAERFWFTSVEGEQPNKSDSGNFFARITRQLLNSPEARITALRQFRPPTKASQFALSTILSARVTNLLALGLGRPRSRATP